MAKVDQKYYKARNRFLRDAVYLFRFWFSCALGYNMVEVLRAKVEVVETELGRQHTRLDETRGIAQKAHESCIKIEQEVRNQTFWQKRQNGDLREFKSDTNAHFNKIEEGTNERFNKIDGKIDQVLDKIEEVITTNDARELRSNAKFDAINEKILETKTNKAKDKWAYPTLIAIIAGLFAIIGGIIGRLTGKF
jgi:hypothetical protein